MSNDRYIWYRSPSDTTTLQSLPACIIMIKRKTKDTSSTVLDQKYYEISKNVSRMSSVKIKQQEREYKKCPKCNWLNQLRNHICVAQMCNHEFTVKLEKRKKRVGKTKNPSGRRGYKKCPKCDALVHIRRFACEKNECGYMFR